MNKLNLNINVKAEWENKRSVGKARVKCEWNNIPVELGADTFRSRQNNPRRGWAAGAQGWVRSRRSRRWRRWCQPRRRALPDRRRKARCGRRRRGGGGRPLGRKGRGPCWVPPSWRRRRRNWRLRLACRNRRWACGSLARPNRRWNSTAASAASPPPDAPWWIAWRWWASFFPPNHNDTLYYVTCFLRFPFQCSDRLGPLTATT